MSLKHWILPMAAACTKEASFEQVSDVSAGEEGYKISESFKLATLLHVALVLTKPGRAVCS